VSAGRFLGVVLGVGLAAGLIWYFLPTLGVAGLLFTQVPVLDQILSAMGIDVRLHSAVHYGMLMLLCVTAPYCLARKKGGFTRVACGVLGAVAAANVAWYTKDQVVIIHPLDITDPAIQAKAFDSYTGAPNLCAAGEDGRYQVYWSYVHADATTGMPTRPLDSATYQMVLHEALAAKEQLERKRQQDEADQARLATQAQDASLLNEMGRKVDALTERLRQLNEARAQAATAAATRADEPPKLSYDSGTHRVVPLRLQTPPPPEQTDDGVQSLSAAPVAPAAATAVNDPPVTSPSVYVPPAANYVVPTPPLVRFYSPSYVRSAPVPQYVRAAPVTVYYRSPVAYAPVWPRPVVVYNPRPVVHYYYSQYYAHPVVHYYYPPPPPQVVVYHYYGGGGMVTYGYRR
jgi:hypothetical protein